MAILSVTCRNAYHFTCTEQKVPDNSEGHISGQNCGSSVWSLLRVACLATYNLEVDYRFLEKFVDPWCCSKCYWCLGRGHGLGLIVQHSFKNWACFCCRCNGDARDLNLLVHKKDIMSVSGPVI